MLFVRRFFFKNNLVKRFACWFRDDGETVESQFASKDKLANIGVNWGQTE